MSLIKDTRRPIEKIITATMLLAFCFGLSSIISATPVSATNTFSINIDNSIALRVLDKTGETAITTFALPLAATPRGAFTSDYFNVEVSSANAFGYRLFMSTDYQAGSPAAYTTDLVNTEDNSVSIPTLSTKGVAKSDFSRPSGSYVNRWGYSLDNTTFNPAPDHTTSETIKFQKQEINRDLVPVYIGANVDSSKISGVYRNVLTFSAIGNLPATGYTLYFDAGTTDPVDNLPATMTAEEQSATHTFTIPSTAPSRAGYTLSGYVDDTTGAIYHPGDTITVAGDSNFVGSAALTAQWTASSFWSINYMQEMTSAICSSLYTPAAAKGAGVTLIDNEADYIATVTADNQPYVAQRTLRDIRDSEYYIVRKLADGKCWMTENLKLVGNATVGYTDLTTTDSDVPAAGFRLTASTAQDYTWCVANSADCDNQSMVLNSGNDSYGTYYNWYTATAGTGTYETSTDGTDVANSICPRGWRLPTSGSSGEFQALYSKYSSSSAMRGSPVNFVLPGYRFGSSTTSQGTYGRYWSSTAYSSNSAYYLALNSSSVYPANYSNKYYGSTVRCVAR